MATISARDPCLWDREHLSGERVEGPDARHGSVACSREDDDRVLRSAPNRTLFFGAALEFFRGLAGGMFDWFIARVVGASVWSEGLVDCWVATQRGARGWRVAAETAGKPGVFAEAGLVARKSSTSRR